MRLKENEGRGVDDAMNEGMCEMIRAVMLVYELDRVWRSMLVAPWQSEQRGHKNSRK